MSACGPSTSTASPNEDITSDVATSSVENSRADEDVRVGNTPPCCSVNTRRFASVAYFAFVFITAVIFLVASEVNTDERGIGINRLLLFRYLAVILFISIAWMATFIFSKIERSSKLFNNRWFVSHIESEKQLLPKRLLVGVMFFGLGSSFMTMVELLESIADFNCPHRDVSMLLYYIVRTLFIYTQLYFFYKLSNSSKTVPILSHGLMMHLIAVNLATWIVTFVFDSAAELESEPKEGDHGSVNETTLTNSTRHFMAHRWGVWLDSHGNISKDCHETAEVLKSTAKSMEPFLYTFTMEYCLISAGLLLNTWRLLPGSAEDQDHGGSEEPEGRAPQTMVGNERRRQGGDQKGFEGIRGKPNGKEKTLKKRRNTKSSLVHSDKTSLSDDTEAFEVIKAPESMPEEGTLWRFGFILGFAYIPAFTAIVFNILFSDDKEQDILIYIGMQFFFFFSILVASLIGIRQLEKQEAAGVTHSEVDYILLVAALLGVFFLDLFIVLAAVCELAQSPAIAIFLVVTNITEVFCSIVFTFFVRKALRHQLPTENADESQTESASKIREVVSFLFMLNLCFWAMYTFEVKRSNTVLDIVEKFYTVKVWFYMSHFVYPLAVFFHFHGAVCMVEILNHFSISKSHTAAGLASASVTMSYPGNVQT